VTPLRGNNSKSQATKKPDPDSADTKLLLLSFPVQLPSSIMPAPSKLAIQTAALLRLVKEEASYHKELEGQEQRIKNLEDDSSDENENRDYLIKQEVGGMLALQSAADHPRRALSTRQRL
jgi:Tubulin binding cofactor A